MTEMKVGEQTLRFDEENAERLGLNRIIEDRKNMEPPKEAVCPICRNRVTTRQFCPEYGTRLL